MKPGPAGSFARQCLLARRLSEAGIRFVEIRQGRRDHHNNLHNGLMNNAAATDKPTAALLVDLYQRTLLEDTLVLFGSEFGRMPTAPGVDGRDHNITGFPMRLAGTGVKAGFSYGSTDEYGLHPVEGRMHTSDLHATLLALMGLDHERLTIQLWRQKFPTDRCGRQCDQRNLCLITETSSSSTSFASANANFAFNRRVDLVEIPCHA